MTVGCVAVVLNWNGRTDTIRCVESLLDGDGHHVLVVDNGSFDGTLEEVATRWPEVATLQTGANLGYAGGMDAGLRWALDRGADHIAVVNNDVVCPPGTLTRLVASCGEHMAISPQVHYLDEPERIWFGAGEVDWDLSWPRHTPPGALAPGPGHRPSDILAGCFVLAPAAVWSEVGLFDERYFLIFEDSDWSMRATAAGVSMVVAPDTPIYHRVSASFVGAGAYLATYYYARNGLLFGRHWRRRRWARTRFLRRRIVPVVVGPAREGDLRETLRVAAVVALALLANALRVYGRAPRVIESAAGRWARQTTHLDQRSGPAPSTAPTGTPLRQDNP